MCCESLSDQVQQVKSLVAESVVFEEPDNSTCAVNAHSIVPAYVACPHLSI